MSADPPTPYTTRPLKWAHHREEGWMSDYSTMIEIQDEGAGEFLHLSQPFAHTDLAAGGIAINPEEWLTLKAAIESALFEIRKHDEAEAEAVSRETSKAATADTGFPAAAFKTQKPQRK